MVCRRALLYSIKCQYMYSMRTGGSFFFYEGSLGRRTSFKVQFAAALGIWDCVLKITKWQLPVYQFETALIPCKLFAALLLGMAHFSFDLGPRSASKKRKSPASNKKVKKERSKKERSKKEVKKEEQQSEKKVKKEEQQSKKKVKKEGEEANPVYRVRNCYQNVPADEKDGMTDDDLSGFIGLSSDFVGDTWVLKEVLVLYTHTHTHTHTPNKFSSYI